LVGGEVQEKGGTLGFKPNEEKENGPEGAVGRIQNHWQNERAVEQLKNGNAGNGRGRIIQKKKLVDKASDRRGQGRGK